MSAAKLVVAALSLVWFAACRSDRAGATPGSLAAPRTEAAPPPAVAEALAEFRDGEVFVAFRDLAPGAARAAYAYRGDELVHAASTMKVPVLVALHRAAFEGRLALDEPLRVVNEFASIVDGSPYTLDRGEDADPGLYDAVGEDLSLAELARRMIVRSSNLATNLLVARLGAAEIQRTIEALGVRHMRVLRGVEDTKAFEAGLSNSATASDLACLMATIAGGGAVSEAHSRAMLAVLEAQEFNELIPAGLPAGTRVAHKTGSITGIVHDAAVVLPADAPPYVLVVLTRGFADPARAGEAIRSVARAVHATRGG